MVETTDMRHRRNIPECFEGTHFQRAGIYEHGCPRIGRTERCGFCGGLSPGAVVFSSNKNIDKLTAH